MSDDYTKRLAEIEASENAVQLEAAHVLRNQCRWLLAELRKRDELVARFARLEDAMHPDRLAALEKVAEAARQAHSEYPNKFHPCATCQEIAYALAALDAVEKKT